jgi:hypothetical protein
MVAMAVMVVMLLLVSAGMASAAPGNYGKGAAHANDNAARGITTAIAHSGGGCDVRLWVALTGSGAQLTRPGV